MSTDELIDDRALRDREGDFFGHADFVDRLTALAESTPTPSSIAVYAPWGSGKSGMAHMVEADFEGNEDVEFFRFDAFKYAEAPLRRQFLTQLSTALLPGQPIPEMYAEATEQHFAITTADVQEFLWRFAYWFGLLLLAGLFAVFLVSFFDPDDYWNTVGDIFKFLAPIAAPVLTLVAAVLPIAGRQLTITKRTPPLTSDEQFEREFKRIVREAIGEDDKYEGRPEEPRKRVVVFVDELDRCSPQEVVSTLETIRTFLEVRGCVFIVAVDRAAIEEAIAEQARQSTPSNLLAPYYSAGGAYLDKIFQYQIPLPPLKQPRVSSFALKLLEGRKGAWERIDAKGELAEAISVLIPNHVKSPRRVKALLNSFLVLYRLAEAREAEGKLAGPLPPRAAEIAKLAALRLEFPLFADDLALDARMPKFVVACVEEPETNLPSFVRSEVRSRASLWASKRLAVEALIVDDFASEEDSTDPGQETEESESKAESVSKQAKGTTLSDVEQHHVDQLHAYLRKTDRIPGPGIDLVFLESAAAGLQSISPSDADGIEIDALDNNGDAVLETIQGLEPEARLDSYRLLAQLIDGGQFVGVEQANAASILLRAIGLHQEEVTLSVANEVARVLSDEKFELIESDFVGALCLGRITSRGYGEDLRNKVLTGDDYALTFPDVCEEIVSHVSDYDDQGSETIGKAFGFLIINDPSRASELLLDHQRKDQIQLIESLSEVASQLRADLEPTDNEEEEAAPRLPGATDFFRRVIEGGSRGVQEVLAAEYLNLGSVVSEQLAKGWIDDQSELGQRISTAIIDHCENVGPFDLHDWLSLIDIERMSGRIPKINASNVLTPKVFDAWAEVAADQRPAEDLERFAEDLTAFAAEGYIQEPSALPESIRQTLSPAFGDEQTGQTLVEKSSGAFALAEAGLTTHSHLADVVLGSVADSILNAQNLDGTNWSYIGNSFLELTEKFTRFASTQALARSLEVFVDHNHWPGQSELAAVIVASRLREKNANQDFPLSLEHLLDLVERGVSQRHEIVSIWLSDFQPEEPSVVWEILSPLASGELDEELSSALRVRCESWLKKDRQSWVQFLRLVIESTSSQEIAASFLESTQFELLPEAQKVELLVSSSDEAEISQARRLLSIWKGAKIEDKDSRRALVNELLLPLCRSEDFEDYSLACEFLDLAASAPSDRRVAVREALRKSVKRFEQDGLTSAKDLEATFRSAGLVKRRPRLLRPDVDEDT